MHLIDWEEIGRLIPDSNEANSPLQIIQSCLEETQSDEFYENVDKQLDQLIQNLQNNLIDKSKVSS